LIPLYTVGVFIAFTLSQNRPGAALDARLASPAGSCGPWSTGWRYGNRRRRGHRGRLEVILGAWMVLVAHPIIVFLMWAISRHYNAVANASEASTPISPERFTPIHRAHRRIGCAGTAGVGVSRWLSHTVRTKCRLCSWPTRKTQQRKCATNGTRRA